MNSEEKRVFRKLLKALEPFDRVGRSQLLGREESSGYYKANPHALQSSDEYLLYSTIHTLGGKSVEIRVSDVIFAAKAVKFAKRIEGEI